MRTLLLSIALTSLLAACASAPKVAPAPAVPIAPAVPAAPAGPPANDDLNAVAWTQTAIEHDLIYREVYRRAGEKLAAALKDRNWDALPKGDRKDAKVARLKPAIIVDIDETVLDNSPYEARQMLQQKTHDSSGWADWCREKSARALPGAREFAEQAAKSGVTMFYVSNRTKDLADVTLDNLRAQGFPIAANETVFLGLGAEVEGCTPVGNSKSCRRELIGRTYRVVMMFGDQLGDFVDLPANTVDGRREAISPYMDWIGERWFVLPNPMYGSWETALFNNDLKLPVEQR
ncbi:MAG: 5'-nucleotidase, lipoprotein e(P4) family, partial [Rhodanobacteraceae bacterium]